MGSEPKDTYKYKVLLDGKTIFKGCTYDLNRRECEHHARWPKCRVVQVGSKVTWKGAQKWAEGQSLPKRQVPPKPGDLCKDNGRLCVLVQIGTSEDSKATKILNEAGILSPFGWFLDLSYPNVRFESIKYLVGDDVSGCWVANLFSRSLGVVEWL